MPRPRLRKHGVVFAQKGLCISIVNHLHGAEARKLSTAHKTSCCLQNHQKMESGISSQEARLLQPSSFCQLQSSRTWANSLNTCRHYIDRSIRNEYTKQIAMLTLLVLMAPARLVERQVSVVRNRMYQLLRSLGDCSKSGKKCRISITCASKRQ